jgi:hypothetical protein
MRTSRAAIALALVLGVAATASPQIAVDRILEHVRVLSADDMKGRGNGTEELERAAAYIARQFESAGLQPGAGRGWLQPFEITVGLAIGRTNSLSIEADGRRIPLELGTGYFPLGTTPNESPEMPSASLAGLPLVFAGYGLSVAGKGGYDDYDGLDVNGKAVLIFSHEPQENDRQSRLNGARPMPQTTLQAKATAARNRGARLLLVLSDPIHRIDEANYKLFTADPDAETVALPVLRVRRDDLKPLIEAWGLEALAREIDRDLVPRSRPLTGAAVHYVEHLSVNRRIVHNVLGVLPGSDPRLAAEAIVIGAHYDHVGIGGRFSAAPETTGQIHNGADDNASGTAAIIEMAREAVRSRARFPRTLVFVAFAGEERGLLGSAHYVSSPVISIDRTVVMLNLDMVGRSRGSVDVSGLEHAPSLEADLAEAARSAPPIQIRREGPGAGRSDDSSFLDRGVPAINFFTGFHPDYHRPTDDWEKVDSEGTRRVAALALEFAARIAARPSRLQPAAAR